MFDEEIRCPTEHIEAVDQMLSTRGDILIDFRIPEVYAIALNPLVLDPRSKLYALPVTALCDMRVTACLIASIYFIITRVSLTCVCSGVAVQVDVHSHDSCRESCASQANES